MYYNMRYEYDNFEDGFKNIPVVRNGTCFKFLDCYIKFYQLNYPYIDFWIDDNNIPEQQTPGECLENISKILSFVFALQFNSNSNLFFKSNTLKIQTNNLLSKRSLKIFNSIEKKIISFNKTKPFFYDMLSLLSVAYDNMYNFRDVDAFLYFFKIIERIAKHHYLIYLDRQHAKTSTRKNKKELKNLMKNYVSDYLNVSVTEDMMNTKIDLLYKNLKLDFYGSVFNKISLFITRKKISTDLNSVNQLVKIRNTIAHGDTIDNETLCVCLGMSEYLAMQMFSIYFFGKDYEHLHIRSYRLEGEYIWPSK